MPDSFRVTPLFRGRTVSIVAIQHPEGYRVGDEACEVMRRELKRLEPHDAAWVTRMQGMMRNAAQ